MTFEQALAALKQRKKVTRNVFIKSNYETKYVEKCDAPFRLKVTCKNGEVFETDKPPSLDDIFADDWEIAEEKPLDGVKVEGLTVKVNTNFDEYMQAVDKFKCYLEELQQAAEELSGMKLEISVDM